MYYRDRYTYNFGTVIIISRNIVSRDVYYVVWRSNVVARPLCTEVGLALTLLRFLFSTPTISHLPTTLLQINQPHKNTHNRHLLAILPWIIKRKKNTEDISYGIVKQIYNLLIMSKSVLMHKIKFEQH